LIVMMRAVKAVMARVAAVINFTVASVAGINAG
jgi:hypothetical protein